MAKRRRAHAPDDPSLLQTGLHGLDELIGAIRKAAFEANSFSNNGNRYAYESFARLLSELHSLAKTGKSKNVSDTSNATADEISENGRIALAFGLNTKLNAAIEKCLESIDAWEPPPALKHERAPLVIGTAKETVAVWNRVASEIDTAPARIVDAKGREAIASHLLCVLECLDAMRSQLRDQLVGRSNEETASKRSWTQGALDEEIRQHTRKNYQAYARLKKAIPIGGTKEIDEAQSIFGRNTIVKLFGVKSPDMVTRSRVWQEIAEDLGLPRGSSGARKIRPSPLRAPGSDVDEEQDFLRLIRKWFCPEDVDETLRKLKSGETTKEIVRKMIEVLESS